MMDSGRPKYWGKYRGRVADNLDPKKLGRIVCRVPEVLGDELTGWAYPVLSTGSGDGEGTIKVPPVGAGVFVEFEAGCVDRPLYLGGWVAAPGGQSDLPKLALGISDYTAEAPKGTDSFVMQGPETRNEPPAPFAAVYPYDTVYKFNSGIGPAEVTVEVDVTPGKERVHVYHPSGSWIEMHPDGSIVTNAAGRRYTIVKDTDDLHVDGSRNVYVEQSLKTRTIDDEDHLVGGDLTVNAGGELDVDIGDVANIDFAKNTVVTSSEGLDIIANNGGFECVGAITINGSTITLGVAGGTKPVARVGDLVKVVIPGGSSAGVYTGQIISGSGKVTAG